MLHDLDGELSVRLEVRQESAEYLDLLCFGPAGRTAIEFKYVTALWEGTDPSSGEAFRLRTHSADDLARRNFVFDIARLERFCRATPRTDGLAVLLTNVKTLWTPPTTQRNTRDRDFRLHEGRTLSGTLRWGGGDFAPNERHLAGTYDIVWQDFSELGGRNGTFRWLAVTIPSGTDGAHVNFP